MRVAVIGCGAVAERSHLPALRALGITPALLVDKNITRAEALAAQWPSARATDDYTAHFGAFDAAIVAVPHALHAPICEELLMRGVHVLVEKPMATTLADCDRMIDAARSSGATLAVGLMRRFRKSLQIVHRILHSGTLGKILSFDFREGGVFAWPVACPLFFQQSLAGGGVLIDTGAHTLDLLLWWLGNVRHVVYLDDRRGGVEADCRLELVLESGAEGIVELSRTRVMRNTAIIRGTKGQIEIPFQTDDIEITIADYRQRIRLLDEVAANQRRNSELFVEQLRDWLAAAESKRSSYVSAVEARKSIALIEECYRSRQQLVHTWDDVGKTPTQKSDPSSLSGRKIMITGATGFIGGRLVEKLIECHDCRITALIRNMAHASRISRYNLEIFLGDLSDTRALAKAAAGCDVVFHCAYDYGNHQANVDASRNLINVCLDNRVSRLVHLSTISVYEPLQDGDITESTALPPTDWGYALAKRTIEDMMLRAYKDLGLPVVILQPSIVYGPFSKAWTIMPVSRLRSAVRFALPADGICNPVYVDDVVEAMIRGATRNEAVGERFLISGSEVVSWRQFIGAYEEMLGEDKIVELMPEDLRTLISEGEKTIGRRLTRDPKETASSLLPFWFKNAIKRVIGLGMWNRLGNAFPLPMHLPDKQLFALYRARAKVQIEHARRLLAYEPAVGLKQGMELTGQFVKWANL